MKVYVGIRDADGARALVKDTATGAAAPLRHVVRHSPTGMEWGYGGSGPSDLALSILADALGSVEAANPLYGVFKWRFVASFDRKEWELPQPRVLKWVETVTGRPVDRPAAPAEARL